MASQFGLNKRPDYCRAVVWFGFLVLRFSERRKTA